MGKSSNRSNGKRAKGKNKKKETFKKYGKNTSRGMRIKQAEMEKKAEKRKKYSRNHPDKHSAQQSAKPSRWGKEPTNKASATKSSQNWWDSQAQ